MAARAKQSEEELRRTLKSDFDDRLSLELREQRLKYESKLNVSRMPGACLHLVRNPLDLSQSWLQRFL